VITLSYTVDNRFPDVERLVEGRVRDRTRDSAIDGERQAQARVAVDTGATRRGIKARQTKDLEYEVVSTEPSSVYLEFGTVFTPPQPFMMPTVAVVRPKYERSLRSVI
jgi:HK97 gp10 family phage protein